MVTDVFRGTLGWLPPPIDDIETYWLPVEKNHVSRMLSRSFVGSPETVRHGLESSIEETSADGLIIASAIYDHSSRLRSDEILADVHKALGRERALS